MNALFLTLVSGSALGCGYAFYATHLERFFGITAERVTPAVAKYDGVDYVPAKHWLVLFGHHFASIAGAGPIVGPVIAATFWGWAPAAIFIVIGTVFIGGVHDLGSLFVSMRCGGSSIAEVAAQQISRRVKAIFLWFLLIALIIVVAVFADLAAKTFAADPKIVIPSLGLIPAAMLVGFMMYSARAGMAVSTLAGLVIVAGLVVAGNFIPVDLPGTFDPAIWICVLLGYCFIAAVLPVNILLQPRDYLVSYLLFFGLFAGLAGIATARPDFTIPAFTGWSNAGQGGLWPMLFVIIACGAVSGFHSLVAGGTTSKQIPNERYAKRIGYGAMVVEAVLAIVAVVAIGTGFSGMDHLSRVVAKAGPVGAFGEGYGNLTRFVLGSYGGFTAVIILNAFILTTLDTATRIARYLLQEIFGGFSRSVATAVVVVIAGWIALSGEWARIWPLFGSANQLIAALALVVITSWLVKAKKPIRYTFAPACFMFVTTIGALCWQLGEFARKKDTFLYVADLVIIALAMTMLAEVWQWWTRTAKHRGYRERGR